MRSKQSLLSFILLLVYVVMALQGLFDYGPRVIVLFGIWLLVSILLGPKQYQSFFVSKRVMPLYAFLAFFFISNIVIQPLSTSINRTGELLFVISPIFIYEYLNYTNRQYKVTFFILSTLVIVLNLYLSFRFQDIAGVTDLRQSEEYGDEYYIAYVAFRWVSCIALLLPALSDITLKRWDLNRHGLLLYAPLIIFLFYFLIRAQYAIAILIALLGMYLSFVFRQGKKKKMSPLRVGAYLLLGGIIFLFVVNLLPSIIQLLDKTGEYQALTYRLQELDFFFSGNKQASTDMNTRSSLATMSFNTFLSHPILGVNHLILNRSQLHAMGIGDHSTWLDNMALYGMWSFFLFFFLVRSLNAQRKQMNSVIPMIVFIALGLLNPLWFFPQLFVTFVYVPMLYNILLSGGTDNRN